MNDSAYQAVCDALARQLRSDAHQFSMRDQLQGDLGLLPMDLDMVALWLEDLEGVELPSERLRSIRSVGQLVRMLREQKRAEEAEQSAERCLRLHRFVGPVARRRTGRQHLRSRPPASRAGVRERDSKRRAVTALRVHVDVAAVRIDDALHQRQPQPDARAATGLHSTEERIEQLR